MGLKYGPKQMNRCYNFEYISTVSDSLPFTFIMMVEYKKVKNIIDLKRGKISIKLRSNCNWHMIQADGWSTPRMAMGLPDEQIQTHQNTSKEEILVLSRLEG